MNKDLIEKNIELIIPFQDIEEINNKAFFIKDDKNDSQIFIKEYVNDFLNDFKKFENFTFWKGTYKFENKEYDGIVVSGKKEPLTTIYNYVNNLDCSLFFALQKINSDFKITNSSFLKFRGDLAESIFLIKKGGKKIFDGASVDIELEGNMIEVKSFSPMKKTIMISHQQMLENTIKFAIEIKSSNNGKTISEIANLIKGNNEFKNYLLKKYSESVFDVLKYEIVEPIDITSKIPKINLPSSIVSASFVIKI